MLAHQISKYGETLMKVFVSGNDSNRVNWARCSWAEYPGVLNTHPHCEATAVMSPSALLKRNYLYGFMGDLLFYTDEYFI